MLEKDFMLGAATAAHQVEGNNIFSDCWALENIKHSSYDEPSGDAVDHYHRFREDIDYLAQAGLNAYRFSIEWARIQPEEDVWVDLEVEHYRQVLEYCHLRKITPMVTLHHFSSPKWVTADSGWENPKIVERFAVYCERIAEELGNLMEYVCTINEANMRFQLTALIEEMKQRMHRTEGDVQVGFNAKVENMKLSMLETARAFEVTDPRQVKQFLSECSAQGDILIMKAHEAASKAMKERCPHLKIGLTLSLHDIQSADGGEQLAQKEWDDEFIHYIPYIKSDDFLGVQCYTRKIFDKDGVTRSNDGTEPTQMGYDDYPQAIGNVLRTIAKDFPGNLIVTENGIATSDDGRRCEFIKEALKSVKACVEDGISVKGYFYWSLLDNFEWQKGYVKTFGVIAVDRATQIRYPKRSLEVLGNCIHML